MGGAEYHERLFQRRMLSGFSGGENRGRVPIPATSVLRSYTAAVSKDRAASPPTGEGSLRIGTILSSDWKLSKGKGPAVLLRLGAT